VRKLFPPAFIVFSLALIGSLAVHLPVYEALGFLAKSIAAERAEVVEAAPVEIEFEIGDPVDDLPAAPTEDEQAEALAAPTDDEVGDRTPERRRPRRQPEEEEPQQRRAAAEEEEEEPVVVPPPQVAQAQPVATPPPEAMNKQAIQQRSQNPNEPPPDTNYIADENNTVEEQTVARLRNFARDDEEQEAGMPSDESEVQELGNADEVEVADAREMEGSDVRTPTEIEANMERPREASDTPPPNVAARGDTGRVAAADAARGASDNDPRGGDEGGARQSGGGERTRLVEVNDGSGSFTIAVRERPEGEGEGEGGGQAVAGVGQGERGSGRRAGRIGRGRRGERGRGRGHGRTGPDLRVSWSQFENVYTEDQLREERETYLEERQSRLRGSNRQRTWRNFRAAIENFVPNVRPGNQTALNAAASPFASYIAAVHRRIHREYAHRFLGGLPAGGTSPFSDITLHTKLEIILNRDGSVHRIGVAKPSGFLAFDYGAYNAVMRGQPYPEAPSSILSGDGKVYVHWGFYRNSRQCGTFNAEPYILRNPPSTPQPGGGGLRDMGQGGVIPADAEPTWGTGGEPSGDGDGASEGDESEGGQDGEDGQDGDRDGAPQQPRQNPPANVPNRAPDIRRGGGTVIG